MKLLRAANNDEQINRSVNEIINECKMIRDSDRLVWMFFSTQSLLTQIGFTFRCEYGSKVMDCINDGGIKRGIKYWLLYWLITSTFFKNLII